MKAVALFCTILLSLASQAQQIDSFHFNQRRIMSLALDANIPAALKAMSWDGQQPLAVKDATFKAAFENRFFYAEDRSDYLAGRQAGIDSLLLLFRDYWRKALLDTATNYDQYFIDRYRQFIKARFPQVTDADLDKDSTDQYLQQYLAAKQLHTTNGIGKTGKLFDLLLWKQEQDTTYSFALPGETIATPVIFLTDFVSLGWEEYATLGRLFPGGWTTRKGIYCVKQSYNLQSEQFLISLLAHEGRHYSDYKLFPKLSSADLEYRGKLTELSMARTTLYDLLTFFINNANRASNNGHSVANYYVIHDLSKVLFNKEFESDVALWKQLPSDKLNKAALQVLQTNTNALGARGKEATTLFGR
ncbi:hypothetical protein [Paraflavitalea sp. CAU 1676]|uniref:hypothetical protein n=1 Tax=Paraflavitalea sp. CAU 1676 TaxID=3032598 RepID=UPI0023DBCCEC|nr:hypothetical protein [Paraflavitalea sp. CAU 1676]MDF2192748.1 hypothetical protein [Paraflavitalea sp. CAU 1676]